MTLRRWTALIAIVGVLAHGVLLVRHHATMMGAAAHAAAAIDEALHLAGLLIGDGTEICRTHPADAQDPSAPHGESMCPICLGWASAAAVLPKEAPAPALSAGGGPLARVAFQDQRRAEIRRLRPPARAPPPVA